MDFGEHIERNGGPDPLTPRFIKFLEERMSGISLDMDGDKEKRPDYACLNGAIVVEIKTLETSPSGRLSNVIELWRTKGNWPRFYGKWPVSSVVKKIPAEQGEELNRTVGDRLGRAVVYHLKRAQEQIFNYEKSNSEIRLRLVAMLNEDFPEYDPHIITYIVKKELRRKGEDGNLKYHNIDAVLYLTERHATNVNGQVTFPITVIHGPGIGEAAEAHKLLESLINQWADFSSGCQPFTADRNQMFAPIKEIPATLTRQKMWELEYNRRPYMRRWSDHDVIALWDFTVVLTLILVHKEPPIKLPQKLMLQVMERTTHLLQESASRGIGADQLKPTKPRVNAAISKVTLGPSIQKWLKKQLKHIH